MLTLHTPLVLLAVLMLPLVGLLAWRLRRLVGHYDSEEPVGMSDGMLLAILILAAFGLGAFLTYVVLGFAH